MIKKEYLNLYEITKYILRKTGLTNYLKNKLRKMDMMPQSFDNILLNLKQRGIFANTVIDIGASDGRWSNEVLKVFPEANFLLIEANNIHKNGLDKFIDKNKNVEYVLAAAGDTLGHVYFNNKDPFGGLAMHEKTDEASIEIPMITVDYCVGEKKLIGPFLLKLDTHGFEIPILNGASKMLKETNIIVIEVYNFKIAEDSLLFYEMCDYMRKLNFRCSGLIDVSYRPKDNFLWQMDLIFVKDTRKEFDDNNYA